MKKCLQASGIACRCSLYLVHSRGLTGARISPNEFGSLKKSDVPIERLTKRITEEKQSFVSHRKHKVISSPIGLSRRAQEKIRSEQEDEQTTSTAILIECSRKEFNHHEGFRFPPGVKIPLFSEYWEKNKYKDSWFTIRRKTRNFHSSSAVPGNWKLYTPDKLNPLLLEALERLKFPNPSHMQAKMLQCFASDNHLFLAAETGSGKTLAYAAPLITALLRAKACNERHRAIVVTATGSLKQQTYEFLKMLCEGLSLVVSCSSINHGPEEKWDILVGTPGLIIQDINLDDGLSNVKNIVMDEADMLLDEGFTEVLTDLFALVPISHSETNLADRENGARVIFCSASCPEDLECLAEGVVDREKLSYVRSRKLHDLLHNVEMKFMRVREMDKLMHLKTILQEDLQRGLQNQTIVFFKDKKTAKFAHDELNKNGIAGLMWGSNTTSKDAESYRVIVATDLASRGVDLPRLSHVINYDMARHAVDFLHRVGRVGRLSSQFLGRVTSFVRTTPEVKLTNSIELCSRLGRPLPNIEADVTSMIQNKSTKIQED